MKLVAVCLGLLLSMVAADAPRFRVYLGEKPTISLERALPVAVSDARAKIPDLDEHFVLHSVTPRSFKGDQRGQHWQFLWQELPFKSRLRGVVVRVYMKDASTTVEEFQE